MKFHRDQNFFENLLLPDLVAAETQVTKVTMLTRRCNFTNFLISKKPCQSVEFKLLFSYLRVHNKTTELDYSKPQTRASREPQPLQK